MHRSWLSPVAFGEWQEKHQIRTVSHSEGLPGNNLPFLLVGRGHFPGLEHSAGYSDLFFLDIAALTPPAPLHRNALVTLTYLLTPRTDLSPHLLVALLPFLKSPLPDAPQTCL